MSKPDRDVYYAVACMIFISWFLVNVIVAAMGVALWRVALSPWYG